jgi:hypothetical protein
MVEGNGTAFPFKSHPLPAKISPKSRKSFRKMLNYDPLIVILAFNAQIRNKCS